VLKLNIFTIPWQQLIYSTAYIHARKNVKRKPTQPHASLTYSPFQSCFHSHCDFTFFSLVCLFQHYALDNCKYSYKYDSRPVLYCTWYCLLHTIRIYDGIPMDRYIYMPIFHSIPFHILTCIHILRLSIQIQRIRKPTHPPFLIPNLYNTIMILR